jgi:hypothetical protein
MPETLLAHAKAMLKTLKLPQRLATQATPEEFLEVLRACSKKLQID